MSPTSGPPDEPVVPIEQLFYDDGRPGIVEGAGAGVIALLDDSIAALVALRSKPLGQPIALAEDEVVEIETLLYRGRAALDRAVELRDAVRGANPPDQGALDELFDLLELARAS